MPHGAPRSSPEGPPHHIPPDVVTACVGAGPEIEVERGECVFRAGDVPRGLLLVIEGRVRVIREDPDGGRRQVLHVEGPGGTLGEVPLFAGGTYPATAIAVERSRLVLLTRDALMGLITNHPELAFRLLARLALRVREVVRRVDSLAFEPVAQRLARHLLFRVGLVGGPTVSLGMSQEELADELGTVREVLVRALRSLREAGVIRSLGRSRFVVVDGERLAALAGASLPGRKS
jgi:CRP/FNR family transcriptional regulator, dissimilatory nitrate respiration regulator